VFLPSDVCAACLQQAEKLKKLNIFVRLTKEVAEIQAKEADGRYINGNDSTISTVQILWQGYALMTGPNNLIYPKVTSEVY